MTAEVIIIGGGASGAFASIISARMGRKVILFEKNERIGRKLRITGKGRCNLTNNCTNDELMNNIPVNPRFLYSAFSSFSPQDTMDFFESLGVPLKTERGRRVFPVSDNANDIADALEKEMKKCGVKIIHETVRHILTDDNICTGVITSSGKEYNAESVLIATGGKSYPATGSTGDGYTLASELGHTVTNICPSLVPLVIKEKCCSEMMGLSLRNVCLSLFDYDKCIFSEQGEMLFTHFGVSGPLVLSASSHIRDMKSGRYRISIDLKPALNEQQLDKRIQRDFIENQNRDFINAVRNLLPAKMIPVAVRLSGIPADKKANSITKEERHKFAEIIRNFTLNVENFRPVEEAIITNGGIPVREINPKTMESRLVSGLFFAGEVIDVDAYTGGFNLQIAFSTAYSAGINM
ncbi:MAG TPA: aminoacetone oxidase family FAD-binding enzyme [Ruminococcus sp.]|nr:aminoacetone oxidase family FAD-binding enzyme [Ruminococcus sp.]